MHLLGKPDSQSVVVVPEADPCGLAWEGRKIAFAQSTAFVTSTKPGDGWKLAGVEHVLAVSHHVARSVEDHFGMTAIVIPPSVDTTVFLPGRKEPSIAFMARKNRIGAERILARARTPGFAPLALEGLPRTDLAEVLSRSSIALVTSPSEGFGLFALEAMASGCLVVGFAGGGGLEFMEDGKNCLLASDSDEEGAAARLSQGVDLVNRGEHWEIVTRALETARRFSPRRERSKVLRFWRVFLARRGVTA